MGNIKIANTEIDTRKMNASGSCDIEPSTMEVINILKTRDYKPYMIDIFYDNMQGVWRWDCKIKVIE